MYELIYRSVANKDVTATDINNILKTAREFNAKNGITGCLLFHKNEFIQILEGQEETIKTLYEKIESDQRHFAVLLLAESEKEKRIFGDWSMAFHQLGENDSINIDKLLFVNNFITLSELVEKPTQASKLFWYMAKQLLEQ